MTQHATVKPLAAVGAEISGVDLKVLSDATVEDLVAAYGEHGVLFFRDQDLDESDHIALAERFGEINVNRFFAAVDGYPQIAEVRKEEAQTTNIGGGWHTDHSYDQIPALGSMLYALETPPVGGDTLFASTCAAYDSLSEGLQQTLLGLRAVHRMLASSLRVAEPAPGAKINSDRQRLALGIKGTSATHPP